MDESYQYDALTRRIVTETAAGTRHYYFNSQWRAIEERVSGSVKAQYVWNPADRWDLIRRRRSVAGTLDEIRFVLRDYLDPAAIINESGTVTERYRYDAFGPLTVLAPDFSVRTTSECAWNFLYHAEFIDALTGLYNYGYRYYHADLGRWISRDPIGEDGGLNLYGFVGNAGMDILDPLGLASLLIDGEIHTTKQRRDCTWTLHICHAGGESGHGINRIAETDQNKLPCGDRLGFVSCNATFLNNLITEEHRIPNLGQGVESNLPYHPDDYRAMVENIRRANEISRSRGGPHIPTPKAEDTRQSFVGLKVAQGQLDSASAQARIECLKSCCCKTITIQVLCSPKLTEALLRELANDHRLAPQGDKEPTHEYLVRVRDKVGDKLPCGKSIKVNCMNEMDGSP